MDNLEFDNVDLDKIELVIKFTEKGSDGAIQASSIHIGKKSINGFLSSKETRINSLDTLITRFKEINGL